MAEYEIRAALRQDNAGLIALERRSPLIVGDMELSFDRSPDYFAGQQLQARSHLAVATVGERPVGVSASAVHTALLLGHERLLSYTHHMRVDPALQRHGVGRALGRWLGQSWPPQGVTPERGYSFIDADNADSLAFAASRGGPGPWPIEGFLQDLPAMSADAAAAIEPVGPQDADDVIELLNRTHDGLELFPGCSRDGLALRLSRSPRYGWAQWRGLRRAGRLVAVAGVFDQGAGVAVRARDRRSGELTVSRALTVLDYGFDNTAAMLELLAGLRALAGSLERQSLQISVAACSPLHEPVMRDSLHPIRFKFLGGALRLPTDYRLRGIYIDPVYL